MLGDFNAKVGNERESGIIGPFGLGDRNNMGNIVITSIFDALTFAGNKISLQPIHRLSRRNITLEQLLMATQEIKSISFLYLEDSGTMFSVQRSDLMLTMGQIAIQW